MNAEIEAMMAANKAAMEESKEEADISQEEMASRLGKKIQSSWDEYHLDHNTLGWHRIWERNLPRRGTNRARSLLLTSGYISKIV